MNAWKQSWIGECLHLLKLHWQYRAAWKGKHAQLYSGQWVSLNGGKTYRSPPAHGFIWMDTQGRRYHSRAIRLIVGAEDFGY